MSRSQLSFPRRLAVVFLFPIPWLLLYFLVPFLVILPALVLLGAGWLLTGDAERFVPYWLDRLLNATDELASGGGLYRWISGGCQ